MQADQSAYLLLIPIWVAGFAALVLRPARLAIAVLVPHMLRLLLLAMPLFGVIYAAIHLARSQVLLVVLATALMYSLGVLYLVGFTQVDLQFELVSGIAFAAGGSTMATAAPAASVPNWRRDRLPRYSSDSFTVSSSHMALPPAVFL